MYTSGMFSGLSSFLLPKTDTFQWLYRKDLPHYEIAIDFTAAGTAPEFHRIPFSLWKYQDACKDINIILITFFFLRLLPSQIYDPEIIKRFKFAFYD